MCVSARCFPRPAVRSPLAELLEALRATLGAAGLPWYVFGAQAVVALGAPRVTADVDVTVVPGPVATEALLSLLAVHFDARVPDPVIFATRTRVLPLVHRATAMPLDLVLAASPLEEEFARRAIELDLGGVVAPVATAEDLIVMKLLAGRPKDLEDATGVIRAQGQKLELHRIRTLLSLLDEALDGAELASRFESLWSARLG